MSEHRIEFVQDFYFFPQCLHWDVHNVRKLADFLFPVREKFMKRRIERPDRNREFPHNLENPFEILALHWEQLSQSAPPSRLIVGQNHFPNRLDPIALEKHVLSAAEADAFGAEGFGDSRLFRLV